MRIEILEAPCNLKLGDRVRLKVFMHHLPFFWESSITEYQPNTIFVDITKHSPFALWKHYHIFEPRDGGTLMTDRVEYKLPFSILGEIANHVFVKSELECIFSARHKKALLCFSETKKDRNGSVT
jgi:ligand-binding SRPBCC domain-containing protein